MWTRYLMAVAGVAMLAWGVDGMTTKRDHPNFMAEHLWKEGNMGLVIGGIGLIMFALWP